MRKYPVLLTLTPRQAESLLQLAGEADLDTFKFDGEPDARDRADAGEVAMERLRSAIARAESQVN